MDRFASYAKLSEVYKRGEDYAVSYTPGTTNAYLVAAIHGGKIEPFTSEIARDIAGKT